MNVQPLWLIFHDNRFAKILKSFRADLRPKGKQVSMKMLFCHSMPNRCRSAGWTGNSLKALLISGLANKALRPSSRIF